MTDFLIRDAEVGENRLDVRTSGGLIVEIGDELSAAGEEVVRADGCALLPALHDHHLHLLALAAMHDSVDCTTGLETIASAPGIGWVRGVRSPSSVDRYFLDRLQPDRPVRVQHRSGGLWMLNSRALQEVAGALDASADVERDAEGAPTGRLWRYDERLRSVLPPSDVRGGLSSVAQDLRRLGVGSVTDATPDLDGAAVSLLSDFPLPVTLLGDPGGAAPWKILLRDHDLPTFDVLSDLIVAQRASGRPVAVHCVTRESLLLTLAVLDVVGRVPGDRIEHGAVIPDAHALLGLTVVTQPGFLADRGDDYLRHVAADDQPLLYPYRSLLDCGVSVLPSSDAPYGPLSPWEIMRVARDRRTPADRVVAAHERVAAGEVLDGYLRDPLGRRRRVEVGGCARLLLCAAPLAEVLADPQDDMAAYLIEGG